MTKGILVVSFGTSYPETRQKTIEVCERVIAEKYPESKVYRAFTSGMVIRAIQRKEGVTIPNVAKALEQMKGEGVTDVYIQPLHIILGSEYAKIIDQSSAFLNDFRCIRIAKPLLHAFEDYEAVAQFLVDTYTYNEPDTATVLMGHGSEHNAFTSYAALDHLLHDTSIYIAAVESYPSIELIEERLAKKGIKKVHLAPFMLVAGDHATNDMASDEEDSWKTYLENKGYIVQTHLVGLGEYPTIQEMYLQHLATIMN